MDNNFPIAVSQFLFRVTVLHTAFSIDMKYWDISIIQKTPVILKWELHSEVESGQHCCYDCKCHNLGLNFIHRQSRNLSKPFQPLLASAAEQLLQLWPWQLFTKHVLYRAARPPHLLAFEGHHVSALLATVLDTEQHTWAGQRSGR